MSNAMSESGGTKTLVAAYPALWSPIALHAAEEAPSP